MEEATGCEVCVGTVGRRAGDERGEGEEVIARFWLRMYLLSSNEC